jgi:SAM-dependent methyltransferase
MSPPPGKTSSVPAAGSFEILARMISSPGSGAARDDTLSRDAGYGPAPMDRLELYRWAVQDPETHAIVLRTMYQRLRPGRQPVVLREDFAGTSAESVAWVMLQRGRRAIAIDLDGPTLEWAERRAMRLLGPLASGITFVQGDVRSIGPPMVAAADIISVLNYSILYLREPEELLSYLRQALNGLAPDGILVLNLFGGAAAVEPGTTRYRVTPTPRLSTERPVPPFEYLWEVRNYDRAAQQLDCRIHFVVPDPATPGHTIELRDAFQYEWRLWSVEELVAACAQAGFGDVQIWQHTGDPSKGADGVFLGRVEPESLPMSGKWSAYIVACR